MAGVCGSRSQFASGFCSSYHLLIGRSAQGSFFLLESTVKLHQGRPPALSEAKASVYVMCRRAF